MKILLHTCCGPCAVVYTDGLDGAGYNYDFLWYNHNIHPYTEYRNRKQALETFAKNKNCKLVMVDEYGLEGFVETTLANPSARCQSCYKNRLEFTAKKAQEEGYSAFSTTLLASPYQNFDTICKLGNALAKKHGLKFIVEDFRERFRAGLAKAREMGLYMQKYCGCIFSEKERYVKPNKPS